MTEKGLYGMVAEFGGPGELIEATRETRRQGYRAIEAYTPYPLEELDEILGGWNPVPLIVLLGGLTGAATAWAMEYYIAAIDYPINVGGRPLYSWPAFIPILFELTVLFASIAAFIGSLPWLLGRIRSPIMPPRPGRSPTRRSRPVTARAL